MPVRTLTLRELNRTYLQRQHLLQRSDMSPGEMLSVLVGLQGQVTRDPYLALWSRIKDFQHDDLSIMLKERSAVRASLMRGTIHLVTADDYRMMFPITLPHHQRVFPQLGSTRHVPPEIVPTVRERSREFLNHNPATTKLLTELLSEHWPGVNPRGLGQVSRFLLPLIQTTPRGIWGEGGAATWALASDWLGVACDEKPMPPHNLIRRYLGAFGPASIADMTMWSGLSNLRSVVKKLMPELLMYRSDVDTKLYDLKNLEIADVDLPAPVRFLPGFDNALLGHKDRRRIISTPNGLFSSTFTVDGFISGTWRTTLTALELTAFAPLSKTLQKEAENEATEIAVFWAGTELPIRWQRV